MLLFYVFLFVKNTEEAPPAMFLPAGPLFVKNGCLFNTRTLW